jgi:hypothetical protein
MSLLCTTVEELTIYTKGEVVNVQSLPIRRIVTLVGNVNSSIGFLCQQLSKTSKYHKQSPRVKKTTFESFAC